MSDKIKNGVKKIPMRRWWILIPVCFLTNFFCGMDRSIISVTLAGGMQQELALDATMVGLVTGITALGAMVLAIPGGQISQRGNLRKILAVCIFGWSALSIVTAFCTNAVSLVAVRFILGFCEGMISPGVTTLITFWFPDHNGERNRAQSAYLQSSAIAAICMGPIAGAIMTVADWHVLFIVVGIASMVTFVLWLIFVYDRPAQAKWLSKEEREHIEGEIAREREEAKKVEDSGSKVVKDDKFHIGIMLRNKYVWALMGIGFCLNIGQFGFGLWIPTLIKDVTSANIMNIGLLTALPNIFVVIGIWIWSGITKKIKSRRLSTALPLACFGLFMLIPFFFGSSLGAVGNIASMCLVATCLMGCIPSLYTLPSLALVKEMDGPARGMMACAMALGAFFGPYIVGMITTATGATSNGYLFMAIVLVAGSQITRVFPKELGYTSNDALPDDVAKDDAAAFDPAAAAAVAAEEAE